MFNRIITFHQNKEEERRLKTLGKDKAKEEEENEKRSQTLSLLKGKAKSTLTPPAKKLKVDAP